LVLRDGGRGEVAIPCGDDEIRVVDRGRGGKVHGVVTAQCMALGKRSRRSCELAVESDHVQFAAQFVDRSDRRSQRVSIDAAIALCGGRGGACFGVDQLAGGDGLGAVPQLGGNV
jgi:hypothetical protein